MNPNQVQGMRRLVLLMQLLLVLVGVVPAAHSTVQASGEYHYDDGVFFGLSTQNQAFHVSSCGCDAVHKYLYCHGDPVNFRDLNGHWEGGLNGLMLNIAARVSWASMTYAPIINAGRIAIATVAIAGFVASPECRDVYIAAAGGNPLAAGEMLAADIRLVSAAGSGLLRASTRAPNIITLRFNGGDASDFRVKTERLKKAADAGGLTVVSNPQGIRDPSAQSAYRRAVFVRYTRYLQQLGMSEAEATAQATKKFQTLQADHKIDLQVSGALSNPNGSDNLQMLDGTVNMSVGSQLQKEIQRLSLQTGDQIDQVDVVGP